MKRTPPIPSPRPTESSPVVLTVTLEGLAADAWRAMMPVTDSKTGRLVPPDEFAAYILRTYIRVHAPL